MPIINQVLPNVGLPQWLTGKESACNAGDMEMQVLSLDQKMLWGGSGILLKYSCLKTPMDRGPGRLQFMGSQKSWTWLSN